jgi:flagellar assembly protein FliH
MEFTFDTLEAAPGLPGHSAVDPIGVAVAEAEAIREQARREGFEAGRLEGITEVRMELEPSARALLAAAEEVALQRAERAVALERDAVELAFEIARKVVAGALEAKPEVVVDIVAGALRTLTERERVVIDVHPDDADLVRESIDAVAQQLGGIAHVDVQADRRVPRGGTVVRTDEGEVDATIDTKLERAREAIVRELRGGGA